MNKSKVIRFNGESKNRHSKECEFEWRGNMGSRGNHKGLWGLAVDEELWFQ